jgi:hypothetical protein
VTGWVSVSSVRVVHNKGHGAVVGVARRASQDLVSEWIILTSSLVINLVSATIRVYEPRPAADVDRRGLGISCTRASET